MNCEHARDLAALAASGDVTVAGQYALNSHLADCAECRAEAAEFAVVLGQLSALHRESPPDHVYAAVRARVAAEITGRRSGWLAAWSAGWPAFVAVLACSVVLVVLLRPSATVANQPVRTAQAESSAVLAPIRTEPIVRPTPRPVARAKVQGAVDSLVVHMFTDDPDVVIYWIADGRGDRATKELIQ